MFLSFHIIILTLHFKFYILKFMVSASLCGQFDADQRWPACVALVVELSSVSGLLKLIYLQPVIFCVESGNKTKKQEENNK